MSAAPEPKTSRLLPPSDLNPRRDAALDFRARGLHEMRPEDYRTLGFMSGLEVHQQLATRSKLFCRCPSGCYVDQYDAEVLRHMRPTLSELGEYDGTALMEFKTRKEIVYQLHRGTVCTYEMDDTPPFEIDPEAVDIALEICQLFELDLVNELHVMRKQYLDGSIPTGFQRTAMIGLRGSIPFRVPELGIDRILSIRQLSLEEDACREVSDIGHRITFRTDRLGMPLTEVVTEPELLTPWELQAGARLVARTTRVCPRTRRGPGAARQDVNVSVAGGRRIEIKGVCHHRGLPLLVHNEGFRQLELLRIRAELQRRGITAEMLAIHASGPIWEGSLLAVDASASLRRSDFAPLSDALDNGDMVAAVRLPGFAGLLVHRTQPGLAFANELIDRVRVIACLTGRPFLIHSDIRGYGLSSAEWHQLHTNLRAERGDAVVVVWGPRRDVDTAVREILLRAQEALDGVPSETRQAFPDGTTGFERILPGPDRMYPDTDTPPLPLSDERVRIARSRCGERPWEREDRYRELGLSAPAARELAATSWSSLFDALSPAAGDPARSVAAAFAQELPRHLRHRSIPSADRLRTWTEAIDQGTIPREAIRNALRRLLQEETTDPRSILEAQKSEPLQAVELEALIEQALESSATLRSRHPAAALRWAMGRVMPSVEGRIAPEIVRSRLAEAFAAMTREVQP